MQIAEHGGSLGIRDRGLLESALARPQNAFAHVKPKPGIPTLAAFYALGIIKNHPFVDGNKRVALVLLELFLNLNGYRLAASDSETHATIMAVASRDMGENDFMSWVRHRARPK